jgi:hypothetical protein
VGCVWGGGVEGRGAAPCLLACCPDGRTDSPAGTMHAPSHRQPNPTQPNPTQPSPAQPPNPAMRRPTPRSSSRAPPLPVTRCSQGWGRRHGAPSWPVCARRSTWRCAAAAGSRQRPATLRPTSLAPASEPRRGGGAGPPGDSPRRQRRFAMYVDVHLSIACMQKNEKPTDNSHTPKLDDVILYCVFQ